MVDETRREPRCFSLEVSILSLHQHDAFFQVSTLLLSENSNGPTVQEDCSSDIDKMIRLENHLLNIGGGKPNGVSIKQRTVQDLPEGI